MKSGVLRHNININNSKRQGLHEVSCRFVAGVVLLPAVDVELFHVAVSRPRQLEHSSFPLLPLPLHQAGHGMR